MSDKQFNIICKQFNIICGILGIILGLLIVLVQRSQAETNPLHEMFKDEFTGTKTAFVYMDNNGQLRRETCTRIMGTLRPKEKAFSISKIRVDFNRITTTCEAAQHYWMVFNMQQRAQAELKEEVALYNKELKRARIKCMVDDLKCSLYAVPINAKIFYWIQFNAQEWLTKEDFIEHFKVGVAGLDDILAWRDWTKAQRLKLEERRKRHGK